MDLAQTLRSNEHNMFFSAFCVYMFFMEFVGCLYIYSMRYWFIIMLLIKYVERLYRMLRLVLIS